MYAHEYVHAVLLNSRCTGVVYMQEFERDCASSYRASVMHIFELVHNVSTWQFVIQYLYNNYIVLFEQNFLVMLCCYSMWQELQCCLIGNALLLEVSYPFIPLKYEE